MEKDEVRLIAAALLDRFSAIPRVGRQTTTLAELIKEDWLKVNPDGVEVERRLKFTLWGQTYDEKYDNEKQLNLTIHKALYDEFGIKSLDDLRAVLNEAGLQLKNQPKEFDRNEHITLDLDENKLPLETRTFKMVEVSLNPDKLNKLPVLEKGEHWCFPGNGYDHLAYYERRHRGTKLPEVRVGAGSDFDATLVSEDAYGWLFHMGRSGGRGAYAARQAVVVKNSSPEPDGSYRYYALGVPNEIRSAHRAVAWTFGLDMKDYEPAFQS